MMVKKASMSPGKGSRTSRLFTVWVMLTAVVSATFLLVLLRPATVDAAATLPQGFQDEVVLSGLDLPTNVEFSDDGRVFVAEDNGLIRVFDSLSDPTPTIFANLRTQVNSYHDRGLLGLALDPDFPTKPYVYVLYTYDAPIGGTAPRWGDECPTPPGPTTDGCVVSGHLSRLEADGNSMTGPEDVLIEDWCQQYPSHSAGDLEFGADGALYVSNGDGASYTFTDYGQGGGGSGSPTPKNPCGDPPAGVGGTQASPTAEGGALRSQDLRTGGDPATLDGAILRVDPDTGAALPDNPLYSRADPNARRIIAYGMRNPFRFTLRPGTNELWLGDVGWRRWEEINRIANTTDSIVENFGWPCYEGRERQGGYDGANLNLCENLYGTTNAVTPPFFTYRHNNPVVAGETCPDAGSATSGLAFYGGGSYPNRYDGALFFADYSRGCIWVMEEGANGQPDPTTLTNFATGASTPVDLEIGPNGDIFYADIGGDSIHRIRYFDANQPPIARATASPTNGPTPLTVNFDGTGSSDPDGDSLSYAWDLDGDGQYDDSTAPKPAYTYSAAGNYDVKLRVTDARGTSDTLDEPLRISAGNTPPAANIGSPSSTLRWKVGDTISFSGSATDQEDGALAGSRLSWSLILDHCSGSGGNCHEHPLQEFPGVPDGSFVAPDHEYPAYLELRLTATDRGGLTDTESVRLDPKTTELSFQSNPTGLRLAVGSTESTAPFNRTVIVGSRNSISAPSPQTLAVTTYEFVSWSDGGAQVHDIVAPATATTYTAAYRSVSCTITGTPARDTLTGTSGSDVICGGGGNDTIKGLGGNDILKGEAGADTLYGGEGDDTLDGAVGVDHANFSGSPSAVTAALVDNVATGEGSDTLVSIEKLTGSSKNDALTGSAEDNILNGKSGVDSLDGLGGTDNLAGGGGNDTAHGGTGDDSVVGNAGADQLFGDEGDDTVDSRDGIGGNDSLDGGSHTNGDTALNDATEKSILGFP